MIILLDIDGVLVPESTERAIIQADGFMLFDEHAAKNLVKLIDATHAAIVLTTNHRISFPLKKWIALFKTRGIKINSISKVNKLRSLFKMMDRGTEIKDWVDKVGFDTNYVIIDDDYSINSLPASIKDRWVMTNPAIGLNDEAANKALHILLKNNV